MVGCKGTVVAAATAAAVAECSVVEDDGVSCVTTAPLVVIAAAVTDFWSGFSVAKATINDSCGEVALEKQYKNNDMFSE